MADATLTTLLKNDEMSLEDKLAAIDAAMANAQAQAQTTNQSGLGASAIPVDPQSFLICDSCE